MVDKLYKIRSKRSGAKSC